MYHIPHPAHPPSLLNRKGDQQVIHVFMRSGYEYRITTCFIFSYKISYICLNIEVRTTLGLTLGYIVTTLAFFFRMGTPATFPHCRRMFRPSTTKFERKCMLSVGRRVLVEDIIMAKLIKKLPHFVKSQL